MAGGGVEAIDIVVVLQAVEVDIILVGTAGEVRVRVHLGLALAVDPHLVEGVVDLVADDGGVEGGGAV